MPSQLRTGFVVGIMASIFVTLLYIQLLRGFIVVAGAWRDVGSNFLGYWLLAVIPGAIVFGTAVAMIHVKLVRHRPELQRRFLVAVYAANLILLVGSMAYYTAYLHK